MQELNERIGDALRREEEHAERFANFVRLTLIFVLTVIALVNALSVSLGADILNFAALLIGYSYGLLVFIRIRRFGYHPMMKYVTSSLDIILVFLLLFLYTKIDIPTVALKNYVFLIVFPLIGLTVFRYDRKLTLVTGGLAVTLYLLLIFYLYFTKSITITNSGYERELFSAEVTYVGQMTKILILVGYILLLSYLAHYSRRLIARLVKDELNLRNQKELTDWELNIASQVQMKFLPHSLPDIKGLEIYGAVEQGKYVGGDYYDFIKVTDEALLIVTADVSGKGVPAALIMAEVRASTHMLASMQIGLEDFMQRLNTLLHQSTDRKSFVTFFAAEINTTRRLLSYVNAGHPPPLLYSEGEVRSLSKGTIPLGSRISLPHLVKNTEDFSEGSLLLTYTDGLLEHANDQGEQFGDERLREFIRKNNHLNAQSLIENLFKEVKEFIRGRNLNDDIGIAVVKHL